jgi:PAS domain S-box-containing protein
MLYERNLTDIIFLVNTDFALTGYFAENKSFLFTPPETFLGKKIIDIFSENEAALFTSKLSEVINSNKSVYAEYDLTIAGELRHYRAEFKPATESANDEISEIVVLIKDITEFQKKEKLFIQTKERFKSIFDNSFSGIALTDMEGCLLEYNEAFCDLLEEAEENLRTKNFRAYTHPEDIENESKQFEELAKSKTNHYRLTKRCITANKKTRWIDASVSIIFDNLNQPQNLLLIFNDISTPVQTKNELEQSNRAKDKLLSIIGHDLRSPMGSITGLIDLLKISDKNEQEEIIKMIELSAKRAMTLLEDLLCWGKTQDGMLSMISVPSDINTILQESIDFIKNNAQAKSINIHFNAEENITVNLDRNMMLTAIRNVLSNAVKFTPLGGDVYCTTKILADECVIEIKDTGIGMDNEIKKTLFQVSSNKSRTGTANEQGSGLGLLICKEFVHKHNGRIEVESEKDKGSTFRIILPLIG